MGKERTGQEEGAEVVGDFGHKQQEGGPLCWGN